MSTIIKYKIDSPLTSAIGVVREVENEMGMIPVKIITDDYCTLKYDGDDAEMLLLDKMSESEYKKKHDIS